jgi:hypothetical protein
MSQQWNPPSVAVIQMSRELAAFYSLYKSIDTRLDPHAAERWFSGPGYPPHTLEIMQWLDAHPEVQHMMDEFTHMDAAQARIGPDDRAVADEALREGQAAVTSGVLGAFGGVMGQLKYPDDPQKASEWAQLHANIGEFVAGWAEQLKSAHETSHWIPGGHTPLHAPGERAPDPEAFSAPWQHGLPPGGAPIPAEQGSHAQHLHGPVYIDAAGIMSNPGHDGQNQPPHEGPNMTDLHGQHAPAAHEHDTHEADTSHHDSDGDGSQ